MSVVVIAAFVIAVLVETALPIAVGFWAESHLDVSWRVFAYGALVFAISQLALRIPLVNLLGVRIGVTRESGSPIVLAWSAFLAATAALFEQGGRYFGYCFLFKNIKRSWNNAVMYGLGHGGLESIFIVGLPTLITLANILTIPGLDSETMGLSPEQTRQLLAAKEEIAALQFWMPLTAALERALMLGFQAAMSVLVLQVFLRNSWRWLGYALGLHFLVDLAAPLAATYVSVFLAEAIVAVFASAAVYWMLRLRPISAPARTRS